MIKADLIVAVFYIFLLIDSLLVCYKARATEEVKTDADMLVPLFKMHLPLRSNPFMKVPGSNKSGFKIPIPSSRFHVVIPLLEYEAILFKF